MPVILPQNQRNPIADAMMGAVSAIKDVHDKAQAQQQQVQDELNKQMMDYMYFEKKSQVETDARIKTLDYQHQLDMDTLTKKYEQELNNPDPPKTFESYFLQQINKGNMSGKDAMAAYKDLKNSSQGWHPSVQGLIVDEARKQYPDDMNKQLQYIKEKTNFVDSAEEQDLAKANFKDLRLMSDAIGKQLDNNIDLSNEERDHLIQSQQIVNNIMNSRLQEIAQKHPELLSGEKVTKNQKGYLDSIREIFNEFLGHQQTGLPKGIPPGSIKLNRKDKAGNDVYQSPDGKLWTP